MEYTVDPKDIVLVRVNYDAYTEEEERMPEVQFELDYEILEETEGELLVLWDLSLGYEPLFLVSASFLVPVQVSGGGKVDLERMAMETSFPIFTELSLLAAHLGRSVTSMPLLVDPAELFAQVWDVEELLDF